MEDILVPLGLFAIIPIIVWTVQHHRQKAKERSSDVIQAMIAKDIEITPEVIKSVGFTPKRTHTDLRTGMILISIGTAFLLFGGFIPDDSGDAHSVFKGLSSFPILIGLSLLLFWYFVSRKDQD